MNPHCRITTFYSISYFFTENTGDTHFIMTTKMSKVRSPPPRGFPRAIVGHHNQRVTFDPEAQPPMLYHTSSLLERPQMTDKKVKVRTYFSNKHPRTWTGSLLVNFFSFLPTSLVTNFIIGFHNSGQKLRRTMKGGPLLTNP